MPGSKKGEHRGNARKRPDKPGMYTHETPGEIMRKAVRKHRDPPFIERKIRVSKIILGETGNVEDITPKEAMLLGMQHNLQAFFDWKEMLTSLADQPPTPETTLAVERCEREMERLLDKVRDHARDVAPFIHPKLQATHHSGLAGEGSASQIDILKMLFDEVNERETSAPIPIEHKPKTGSG